MTQYPLYLNRNELRAPIHMTESLSTISAFHGLHNPRFDKSRWVDGATRSVAPSTHPIPDPRRSIFTTETQRHKGRYRAESLCLCASVVQILALSESLNLRVCI